MDMFISVGATATARQEAFVRAVEDRLRAEELVPHTVGRTSFSSDAPLKAVTALLDKCCGTIVIALERSYFANGAEKRGSPNEKQLADVRLPTPWNQIEAAMAYSRGHPLLVIVEQNLKSEGLLERGYDWFVQWIDPSPGALASTEFNGIWADWKSKVVLRQHSRERAPGAKSADDSPEKWTILDLLGRVRLSHLWSMAGAAAVLLGGAFALGAKFFP